MSEEDERTSKTFKPEEYLQLNEPQRQMGIKVLELEGSFNAEGTTDHQFLDVGCGPGDFTRDCLLPRCPPFRRMVAADKSEVLVQYAREHFAHPKICYDVLDIGSEHDVSDFVERYGEFDCVYSFFCLHWIRDQVTVLKNVARLMKPGGECFLIFNAYSPPMRFHKKLATMHRWEKYREILEGPIPPSVDLETKEDLISYVKGLLETAELTPTTCDVMKMEHKFASLEHLIDFQMAFNRLGRSIMEEERPLLLKDVTEECTKWWAEQEAGGSPLDGKVFVVRAHKPQSEARSVVN
uniref:Putative juvenile hormone acid methyltransferase n=1 Tax=Ixodes ricinus TaxID=34613 RepID=V5HVI5_IXORI